jgi:glycosyltransferase involved in cell wall biosynthesis
VTPLVSILIPCFNAERWVAQAIESARSQTWPEKEVIVIDDGSTDASLKVIKNFGDRIRWETGPNRGANLARNRLLELARGDWLQYLDADDYLLPEKIERQLEFLAAHPDTDVVFGPVTMEHFDAKDSRRELLPIPDPHDPWILLVRVFLPQTGSLLWRKEAVLDVGAWKPDQPCYQDQELYLRLLMAGKRFAYCPHAGAVYRQWGEHTVSKRDMPEVHRQRLEIEQRAEDFLRGCGELTPARLYAINQGRFERARSVWQYDPACAAKIMEAVCRLQPDFVPSGNYAPRRYQSIYRLFGFRAAEKAADMRRNLMNRLSAVICSPAVIDHLVPSMYSDGSSR